MGLEGAERPSVWPTTRPRTRPAMRQEIGPVIGLEIKPVMGLATESKSEKEFSIGPATRSCKRQGVIIELDKHLPQLSILTQSSLSILYD